MKICEAAETVLRDAGEPMHVRDIHRNIVHKGLFEFKAKDPISVLSRTLRKNAVSTKASSGQAIFTKMDQGTYGLTEWKQ